MPIEAAEIRQMSRPPRAICCVRNLLMYHKDVIWWTGRDCSEGNVSNSCGTMCGRESERLFQRVRGGGGGQPNFCFQTLMGKAALLVGVEALDAAPVLLQSSPGDVDDSWHNSFDEAWVSLGLDRLCFAVHTERRRAGSQYHTAGIWLAFFFPSLSLDILAAGLLSIAVIALYNLNHNILLIVIAHAQKQITA